MTKSNSYEYIVSARWLFPVSGPPLANGTITLRGSRIVAVEPHGVRTPDDHLGNKAILPGLVNGHTHLDLSGAVGLIPPPPVERFTDWLRNVIAYRRTQTADSIQRNIHDGIDQCLRFGTTLVGDITVDSASMKPLMKSPLRAVVFEELIGLDEQRLAIKWPRQAPQATVRCRYAISPHAPYTVHAATARRIWASEPMTATHIAETPQEAELLEHRRGPFVTFLESLGVYRSESLATSYHDFLYTDIRHDRLLIHCNYLPLDFAFRSTDTVVYCPRTHAAFGHLPHPFQAFLAKGVRVALGTDSLASNPDLDVLAEARFIHQRYPEIPGEALLRMITLSGAEALGFAKEVGSLEVGKAADMVAVPLPNDDTNYPYELLWADTPGPRRVMIDGEWLSNGSQ